VREQPIDWSKILSDRDSRIRYYNTIWIFAQIIEQVKQQSKEANKDLEKSHQDILDKGYTLSDKDTDCKSNVKEFVKDAYGQIEWMDHSLPSFSSERELLGEAIVTEKEIRIMAELPGVSEENIAINVYPVKLVIIAVGERADYCGIFNLPDKTDINCWKHSFSNGILEIIFKTKN
jgi:HSP20 family molecular chaperone IbpA